MYRLEIDQQCIVLNGTSYTKEDILSAKLKADWKDEFGLEILAFLQEWFDEKQTIELKTSGSTGVPQIITASKKAMMQSAYMTCQALELTPETTALLCLPMSAIAGKMMLVRSIISGINLYYVAPSGHPLKDVEIAPDFVAMVPLQVYNSLLDIKEKKTLREIKNLIIGGGFIDEYIINNISSFPHSIYATYGMTETLSHIALRKLNGKEQSNYYTPFKGVQLSTDKEDCLQIVAPYLFDGVLQTNDIVSFSTDGSFKILGRKDNIINTGGVKIQTEELEESLSKLISGDFAITSIPDPKFGEAIVLLHTDPLKPSVFESLDTYQIPKSIYQMSSIPVTRTGKVDRVKCKEIAKQRAKEEM